MSYGMNGLGAPLPQVAPIPDAWYQAKARELQRIAASTATSGLGRVPGRRGGIFSSNIFMGNRKGFYGFGQDTAPPPAGAPNAAMLVGWGAVMLAAVGIFWGVTRMGPRSVSANRRRRSSRRPRGNSRRPRVRPNRTLTASEKEKRESARKSRDWERGVEMYFLGMGSPGRGTRHTVREGYSDARKSDSYGNELYNPYSGRLHSNRRRTSRTSRHVRRNSVAELREGMILTSRRSGKRFRVKEWVSPGRGRPYWVLAEVGVSSPVPGWGEVTVSEDDLRDWDLPKSAWVEPNRRRTSRRR